MGGDRESPCERMCGHDCRCHHFLKEESMPPPCPPSVDPFGFGYGVFHSVMDYRVHGPPPPPHHRAHRHRHRHGHSRHHRAQYLPAVHLGYRGPWFDPRPVPPLPSAFCSPPPPPPPPPAHHHYGY